MEIGKGIGVAIIFLMLLSVLVFWAGYEIVDWLFIDDSIRVSEPIIPEIELTVKNNVVDTIYIYRKQ